MRDDANVAYVRACACVCVCVIMRKSFDSLHTSLAKYIATKVNFKLQIPWHVVASALLEGKNETVQEHYYLRLLHSDKYFQEMPYLQRFYKSGEPRVF